MLVKCEVCGLIHEADAMGEKCPKCGAPKEKFIPLSEEEAEKVTRSQKTNDLHAKLIDLMRKVEEISDCGIEDNLDPGCVKIFKEAKEAALMFKRKSMAELAGHVGKGKY